MLSLPDFHHKKVLFVDIDSDSEDYGFRVLAHTFCQMKDGAIIAKTPLDQLFAVFIIGTCSITTPLIKTCHEYGINLFFLGKNYALYGACMADAEGNYILRKRQYTMTPVEEFTISSCILRAKLTNQSRMLRKYDYPGIAVDILKAKTIADLMGTEGRAGKLYFQALFGPHNWVRREPQTKLDPTNLLMDMGYTYLLYLTDSLLRAFGFDTYKGVYHRIFFKRKSLSCDVMEVFRPIIDDAILKAYRLGQIQEKDYVIYDRAYFIKPNKEIQRKYAKILLEALTHERDQFYSYCLGFYRHMMNPTAFPYPTYLYPARISH